MVAVRRPGRRGAGPRAARAGLDLAASGLDEHVLLWDLDVDGWYAIACRAAGRNLTAEEWARFGPRDQAYRPTCAEWPPGL